MSSPVDIRPDHLEIVQGILREHLPMGVKVWVFGSRANWSTKDSSDLDLALESESKLSHKLLGQLKNAFEVSMLPYTVDVVDLSQIGDSFRQIVKSQRVPLPAEEVATIEACLARGNGQWRTVKLGDVCIKIGSGATPRGGKEVYLQDGPFSLIRSQNVYNDRFHRDGLASISELHADELRNVEVFEDDVLLNITGDSVARVCQVATDVLPARVNQHVAIVRPDPDKLDAGYLRYCLVSPEMQAILLSLAGSGATRNALTKGMIESLEIPLPPLPEQRAIAHVLGTLDDKIELNRRMNETLEAMARALFKSWFVDFEPVRAKMEGRWRRGESLPGLPAEHYDLFPDRLVDSELGEIPEGWEVKVLGSLLETLETGHRPHGGVGGFVTGIPSVGAESIEQVGVFDFSKTKYVPLDFYGGMKRGVVEEGDVLIYKDGGRPGELEPAVTYISRGFPFRAFCINEHVYRVRTKRFSQQLLYCYLTTSSAFWQMRELATGVAQPGLNRRAVESIAIAIPLAGGLLAVCQEKIGPLLDECNINGLEYRRLSRIRDALLPRLVSGEVGVRTASHSGITETQSRS